MSEFPEPSWRWIAEAVFWIRFLNTGLDGRVCRGVVICIRQLGSSPGLTMRSTDILQRDFEIPTADDSGDHLVARWLRPRGVSLEEDPVCPLIVLLHELGGHAESCYIQQSATWLLDHGRDVLLFNFRGAGESAPLCKQHNHPGRSEDLRDLFRWIGGNTRPNILRCGGIPVGFSLGGNILLKFLAEIRGGFSIPAALTVSAPLDLAAMAKRLDRIRNPPYRASLLYKLRQRVLDEDGFLSAEERKRVRTTTSIWEFDKDFTAPRNGCESVEAYYADNLACDELRAIRVPTLLIYASDDPFVPGAKYDRRTWDDRRWLFPAVVGGGGHVGFVPAGGEGLWHNRCVLHTAENLDLLPESTAVGQ